MSSLGQGFVGVILTLPTQGPTLVMALLQSVLHLGRECGELCSVPKALPRLICFLSRLIGQTERL